MKKLYTYLFFLSLLFFSTQTFAQLRVLQIDSTGFLADTLTYGDSATYVYRLRNISDSNAKYIGQITTYLKTDLNPKPQVIDTQSVNISNGSFATIIATIHIKSPYFEKDQRSIVVVWPTGTGSVIFKSGFDSITMAVEIANNVSVQKMNRSVNYVRFYPNPTQDILHFEMLKPEAQIHKIILRDMQGRAIKYFDTDLKNNAIDLGAQKAGIYFMEIIFSDNKSAKYRVIKTE
jgi:hypothetical protein